MLTAASTTSQAIPPSKAAANAVSLPTNTAVGGVPDEPEQADDKGDREQGATTAEPSELVDGASRVCGDHGEGPDVRERVGGEIEEQGRLGLGRPGRRRR